MSPYTFLESTETMSKFISLKSVTEAHKLMGIEKPKHPLISIFTHTPEMTRRYGDIKVTTDLYFVSLKEGIKGSISYGRNSYDFDEGTLIFTAPGQVVTPPSELEGLSTGWSILFHPDLIRKSELGKTIETYSFFEYETNEALHLSDKEKQNLTELVNKIEDEIDQNIDKHSQSLIVSNIELILRYCSRYYDRQFYTRSNLNQDTVSRFKTLLKDYFNTQEQRNQGLPSVKYCAEQLHMSPNYLSDLMKKETGKSAQDHIHNFIIDKAKNLLLSTNVTVSQVAYDLGFDYSQHFSKLFKLKTGMSPKEYRSLQ